MCIVHGAERSRRWELNGVEVISTSAKAARKEMTDSAEMETLRRPDKGLTPEKAKRRKTQGQKREKLWQMVHKLK